MKLQLTVPSKTYLVGEYLSLQGGPALLLNTAPRFKLTVNEKTAGDNHAFFPVESPAGKYLKKYQKFFKKFSLTFHDPYDGKGGFGASSAQFCLLAAFKNYYQKNKITLMDLLAEYKKL